MRPIEKNWPLVLVALELAVFAGMLLPWIDWNTVAKGVPQPRSQPVSPVQLAPGVLLVSVRESDLLSVPATVEPRGYSVLLADNVEQGLAIIGRQRDRIAIVVVDTALPHSKQLLQCVRSVCPRARLVTLHGPRRAGQVSALLIDNAVN